MGKHSILNVYIRSNDCVFQNQMRAIFCSV